jgi:hypothetical protein
MSDKIKIDKVAGGKDKKHLKGCYFVPSSRITDAYDFFDQDNNLLRSDITEDHFPFVLQTFNWEITDLVISPKKASGKWMNDNPADGEDGSFQAQSGGGGDLRRKAIAARGLR